MLRDVLTLERLRGMDPDHAAAHFIARRADGLAAHEEELLAAWRSEDEAHERAFARADHAWDLVGEGIDNDLLVAMRAHALQPRRHRQALWQRFAAIAAVLLVIVGAGWLLTAMNAQRSLSPEVGAVRYAAGQGAVKEIALPDGSRMTLDADSAAVGRFGPKARALELEGGRAYFAVKADPARPFTVDAAGERVTAVGTAFDVGIAEGTLTVTLVEGRVTVGTPGAGAPLTTLEAGQQLVKTGGVTRVRTLGTAAGDKVGWRQGLMDFDDQTLASAAAQVNRYSRRQIVVRDAGVAAMRVSGQFRAGDAARFAATIAELYPVRAVRRGETIELVRKK